MTSKEAAKEFTRLFRGNTDFYVKHQAPFTEAEGKLKASWCGFAVYNTRNPPPEGRAMGDFIPLTPGRYREHLNGGDGLAVAPLMNTKDKSNVCRHAAIDIDVCGTDYTWLVRRLQQAGLKFAAFPSKSGGLHIYFFFAKAEQGKKVIAVLGRVVEVFGLLKIFKSGETGKVEIFPKQAEYIPGKSNASCLLLPFYNAAGKEKCRTKMLTPEGDLIGIAKALPVIRKAVTSVKEINAALDALPYSDAPYCVQMLLLTGALGENDGRNNFLFSAAVYLKKKRKKDFYDELSEMNDRLDTPLEEKDVYSVYKSVTEHGYNNYACSTLPCSEYCDKKLCAAREFGKTEKGSGCWGELSKVMAMEPYYLWKVHVRGEGEYRTVRIDSVDDLQSQTAMQRLCWRDLNWAPQVMKTCDWTETVNKAMEGIESRLIEVPKEMDTSEKALLRKLFIEYLTRCRAQNGQPYMVPLGQVYYAEGAYYFDIGGFMKFLNHERFSLRGHNLNAELESYGCVNAEVTYTMQSGTVKAIPCCKKPEDDELRRESAVYEDAVEKDAELLRQELEETDGGDVKF